MSRTRHGKAGRKGGSHNRTEVTVASAVELYVDGGTAQI